MKIPTEPSATPDAAILEVNGCLAAFPKSRFLEAERNSLASTSDCGVV